MRNILLLMGLLAFSLVALGQRDIPTFLVNTNDVVQSDIRVFRFGGTNGTRVSVKFAFTESGAKRLAEFYGSSGIIVGRD